MEILVIDSGSEQQESKIVQEFQKCHPSIRLLRTNNRESLYKSWNLAITKAQGEYLTNANTDDRHHPKCIELLSQALDENPASGLSYGNLYKSLLPNAKYGEEKDSLPCYSQQFFPGSVLLHYPYGAQPLWRKNLHEKVGFFEEEFKALGDYDFALRLISNGITSKHVPDAWGKMLWHDDALSTRDFTPFQEKQVLIERHRNTETVLAAYKPMLSTEQALLREEEILDECFLDLGLRSLCYYPQFSNEDPHLDLDMLDFSFSRKIEDKRFANNRLLRELLLGKSTKRSELLEREGVMQANLRFSETGIGAGEFHLYPSNFMFPTETKLKKMQNHYLFPRKDLTKGEKGNLFVFCFEKFWNHLLKNIPVKELPDYEKIYVWGVNDKGMLLGSWLKSQNLRFSLTDSNPASHQIAKEDPPVLAPDKVLKEAMGRKVAVILAMSSHHHSNLMNRLETDLDQVDVFPL